MQGRSAIPCTIVVDICQNCRVSKRQAFSWNDWPENYPLPEGWEQQDNNLLCEKCYEQTRLHQ